MRIRVIPYKPGSQSARTLAEALGGRRLRLENCRFRARPNDVVINWGNTTFSPGQHNIYRDILLNPPNLVSLSSHKTTFFQRMAAWNEEAPVNDQVNIPDWTTSRETALQWRQAGETVICRTMLRASGGRGIVVCNQDDFIPEAPLYTKYMKKYDEYRVHVINGRVFHIQHKRRRREEENVNNQIRNHDNGWVFTIQGVEAPPCVGDQAIKALIASGLDFGAVDIIYNAHYQRATVLEINTAPGLEGTTYERYVEAFRNHIEEMRND